MGCDISFGDGPHHAHRRYRATEAGGQFPIAVLDCADDPILTARTRDAVAARYPSAWRLTLPAGGHYPHVTQAREYNRFVESVVAAC